MSDEDLAKKFREEIEECSWDMLSGHYHSGAVYVIAPELDLVSVGVALAEDDVDTVQSWQSRQKLRPPNQEEIELWESQPHRKMAKFIICQPYVIIQAINLEQLH